MWVWPTALMGVCTVAVWRGRDHERLAAAGYLAAWALSMVVFQNRSREIQWNVLFIDLGLLGLYVGLALRSRRYWPMFAASFQLLAVLTHVARLTDDSVSGWAYLTAEIVWGYLVIGTIGYASWTAGQAYDALAEDYQPE